MAGIAVDGPAGPAADFDDYSLYSDLSDDELIQLAIERSLSNDHNSTDHTQATPRVVQRQPNPTQATPGLPSSTANDPSNPVLAYQPSNPAPLKLSSANPNIKSSSKASRDGSTLVLLIKNGNMSALEDIATCNPSILIEPHTDGLIALHEAAYYGQEDCLRVLMRAHPDMLNKRSLKGQTPLHLAAALSHVACVKCLLDGGANPNIPNKAGETPLFKACESQCEETVKLLLKFGALVNRSCNRGFTPLHEAAREDQQKICEMLLSAGADMNASNIYGIKPFFTAAENGRAEMLRLLNNRGADVDCQASDGSTPLYEACKNGFECTVKMLLSLKADANLETRSGILPIHVAAQAENLGIVAMLILVTDKFTVQKCGISPLHYAAENNMDGILEMLIAADYDVNCQLSKERSIMYKDQRRTALYFSIYNCNVEAATMLLEAGANPNLDLFNPLLLAVLQGSVDMVSLLVEHGANVNACIPTQPSAFPSAVMLCMKHRTMLKYLLDNGCDALSCFNCRYGSKPHPPVKRTESPYDRDMRHSTDEPPNSCVQFCDAISEPLTHPWAGPIISVLLDYVGHVKLCSRLLGHLDSCGDWADVKEKAIPPHPLMQLCRLKIRQSVGVQRLKHINTLPLPRNLIKFLSYAVQNSLVY